MSVCYWHHSLCMVEQVNEEEEEVVEEESAEPSSVAWQRVPEELSWAVEVSCLEG